MILAPTNRRIIRPYDKPSFEHTQRYGLIRGHLLGPAGGLKLLALMNEASGNKVFDLSGNSNTGTLSGVIWGAGNYGSALSFDGANDFVTIPQAVIPSSSFTIIFSEVSTPGNSGYFLSDNDDWQNLFCRRNFAVVDKVDLQIGEAPWDGGSQPITLSAGVEHVHSITHNSSGTYEWYIDGVSQGTTAGSNFTGFTSDLYLGNRAALDRDFQGKLNYCFIYNRVLSASEIALLYREPFCMVQKKAAPVYFFVPTEAPPTPWDLLDEDCSDISDWVDGDAGNGVSEVSPAGQFRMDGNAAHASGQAWRYRDIGSIPDIFTFEIKLYHDKLGTIANQDYFSFAINHAEVVLVAAFATDGLFISDGDDYNEVGTDLVKHGGSAEWQTWRFVVDMTTPASAVCDIYLTDSTHEHEKVGSAIDCSYTGERDEGLTSLLQYCRVVSDQLTHIDYVKAATGALTLEIAGLIEAQSGVIGNLHELQKLAGLIEAQSGVIGNLQLLLIYNLTGLIDAQSSLSGDIELVYAEIPPVMHEDLIDPYGDMGAWIWLVEIVIPTQITQRIARNTEAVVYGITTFAEGNFDPPGQIPLVGDGSIPRIQLRVAQDGTGTLENFINATKGGENGTVKLIRTCEKYFNSPVKALERTYDILTAGSDPQWATFSLGIPNPLTQRIPLWSYSSKVCPLATPSLFKGPRCQYDGEDATCTGLLEDCYTKGNAEHWGAELGLDPNAVRV